MPLAGVVCDGLRSVRRFTRSGYVIPRTGCRYRLQVMNAKGTDSMNRLLKRPSVPTVIATLALVFAMAGVAPAAKKLITGKDIAKNAITTTHVKDHTLKAADFAPGVLKPAAAGPAGPAGPRRRQGRHRCPGPARATPARPATTASTARPVPTALPAPTARPASTARARSYLPRGHRRRRHDGRLGLRRSRPATATTRCSRRARRPDRRRTTCRAPAAGGGRSLAPVHGRPLSAPSRAASPPAGAAS